jgi:Flp pilus assembly protein TadG
VNSNLLTFIRRLGADRSGAAMVEFSLVVTMVLMLTGGLVEFTIIYGQWNAASKAMHLGSRLASVSDPIASNLKSLVDPGVPGSPWTTAYTIRCSGATSSCDAGTYDAAAMNTLIYGRGDATCGNNAPGQFPGMCDIFPNIRPQNVVVTYQHTGLGFAARPGGPVPTITVELTGLQYNFALLKMLPGLTNMTLPAMRTTATGEDLGTTWAQ